MTMQQKIMLVSKENQQSDPNKKKKEIEIGLDFILSHLEDPTIFPRTIMTKKLGYQRKVYSKERALEHFIESDFIDCRINAFPLLKEGVTWIPELLFIDLDRNNFKTEKGFEVALSTTLKNIKKELGNDYDGGDDDIQPTVLFTGGGYHIYQPVYFPTPLENVTEFQKFEKPSQEFLRFAKDNLSSGKADKQNNPSFKSCLLRIPGSINFKYDTKVKIIQKWNKVRPPITREFIEEFRTYLIQKKIDENEHRQKMLLKLKRQQNNYKKNTTTNNRNYYEWIDKKILANSFEDYRKIIVNLILAPYLIVIKKLSFEDAFKIINEWLQKCDLLRRLDFNVRSVVNTALVTAQKKQIPPMTLYTLKNNYKNLYFLIEHKKGKEGGGG
jgi:hypothetical protein